jgi:small GTP-binding protein
LTDSAMECFSAVDGQSLLEREILAHLPLARTEQGLRMLLAQGDAWQRYQAMPIPRRPSVAEILEDKCLWWMLHPPRVAIVGGANVGKSTLANQLFAQERSITADVPGTTRDWVGESANIDGLAVILIDTPGLRETEDVIEKEAIARSSEVIAAADLVITVIDATIDPPHADANGISVLNKCDLAPARTLGGAIRTVATTGEGVDELRAAVRAHFRCASLEVSRPRWWTRRQREILQRALEDPQALRLIL